MKEKVFFLIIVFLILDYSILYAQQELYSISGNIVSSEGEPLPGATIYVHEINRGTSADVEGNYEIRGLRRGPYHLHVTHLGHEAISKTINISNRNISENFILQPSSLELKGIVVEASPFKSGPVEQSLTIETVERNFIERNSSVTFVNALQKIPGINSINTGVGIAKPMIRGLSFNRIMVNDRGIKQEGQQWGADHGLEIDQYDPERVEIKKGPSSLIYGSDAMGGVINIIAPPLPQENTLSGSFLGAFKSLNNLFATSTMVEGNRNGFVSRFRFSSQDYGDYRVPAEDFVYNRFVLPIHDQRLKNTAGNERNLTAMAGISKNWGYTTLTLSNFSQRAGLFPGAIGIPREYQLTSDGNQRNIDVPRQLTNHFKAIANANILFKQNWLEMDLGYQQNIRREESNPHAHGRGPAPEGILALGLNLQTYSMNLKYHQQINGHMRSIYGIQSDYQVNRRSGFEFLLSDYTSGTIGSFIYQEFDLNSTITFNGGLRYDYGYRNIEGYSEPVYANPETIIGHNTRTGSFTRNFRNLSGATGISWYPSHEFNAKLNLGSSFRMPTAPELSANGVHHGTFRHEMGDSTLTTERGWQTDLNLTYHTETFHFSFTPFYNYFSNFIYLSPSGRFSTLPEGGQVYQHRQDNAIFTGFELSADYHFFKELHFHSGVEYVWNINLNTSLPLPFTPPFSILGELEYTFPFQTNSFSDAYIGIFAQRFAAQNRVDRNEKPTPGYSLFNFSSGFNVRIRNQPLNFIFTIQNLTNTRYMNHLSRYRLLNLPEPGRNFTVTLKIPFSLIENN